MWYEFLEQITMDLYADNGVNCNHAIVYTSEHGNEELEKEAFDAFTRPFGEDETDAHVMAYGEQSDMESIKHRYPLLDKYLEKAFGDLSDV